MKNAGKIIVGFFTLTAVVIAIDAFWFERYKIVLKKFHIRKKPKGILIKILQVSDTHLSGEYKQTDAVIERINEADADLILFTGDVINDNKYHEQLRYLLDNISQEVLKAAILGNRELKQDLDLEKLRQTYDAYNCTLLVNESKTYKIKDSKVVLTGLDDLSEGNPNIDKALGEAGEGNAHIIMIHEPKLFERIDTRLKNYNFKVDFVIAGHTHGGQVDILENSPVLPPHTGKYKEGWFAGENTNLFVSKGVGTHTLPLRFSARAELVLFNFYL